MNSSKANTRTYALIAQQLLKNLAMKKGNEFQIHISEQSENEFSVRLEEPVKASDENKKPIIHIQAGLYDLFW